MSRTRLSGSEEMMILSFVFYEYEMLTEGERNPVGNGNTLFGGLQQNPMHDD